MSRADADLQAQALRFHLGPDRPVVHHFLALDATSARQAPASHDHGHDH